MNEVILGVVLLTTIILGLTLTVISARAALMPSRDVTIEVNKSKKIKARTGLKLLSFLNDNDILVPSACAGAGTCGLCRVKITTGGSEALPTEAAKLTNRELAEGLHLACQVVVRGDMNVVVSDDQLGAERWKCKVHTTRYLTPLIKEITFDDPPDTDLELAAGSFVQVTAPAFDLAFNELDIPPEHQKIWQQLTTLKVVAETPVTRAYSVSNVPADKGYIVLNVRLALPPPHTVDVSPGIVSSYLFGLRAGDSVELSGPYGSFAVQDTDREMVFIGGGVGMAPLRAMIFDQLQTQKTNRKISYWYGARSLEDVFYADEFEQLALSYPNFDWTLALSDPKPEDAWTGATGFVHRVAFEHYLKDHPAPQNCEYYLCGPPMMIKTVLAMLDEAGVERGRIYNDDFGS